ncbi:DNA recombination protein RmuC [Humidisolicoccus flavus]|uniref:DNA recombination protein RmuC n=1 Tax=Humidisolicoccus flavus TaxID=3111414 RepID=UPI003244BF6D
MDPLVVIVSVVALIIGAALGALFVHSRGVAARAKLEAAAQGAEQQHERTRAELHQEREETKRLRLDADARVSAARDEERSLAEARLNDERERAAAAHKELAASWQERLTTAERNAADDLERERAEAKLRLEELRNDQQRLSNEFEALSKKALQANAAEFLEQAEERLKRSTNLGAAELAKREEAVKQLVEPLTRTLDTVKAELTTSEKARSEANAALAEQLRGMRESSDQLKDETKQLVTALRAPQVRGRWGELQLRRVVEAAGMVSHVDFEEQSHHNTDEGALRPDLIVKLPGNKQIIVDAKVAFNGYLEAMEAKDDQIRASRLKAHARHLKTHIDQLGGKAYWEAVEGSPEFVVMFVPAEAFLNAALEEDPTLFEHAFARNVILATPATLIALLRTVGYTWRQEQLAGEAMQIFTVGRELHKRLGTLGGHLTKLGKRLNSTVDAFNEFNTSLDRNVVTQARRFSALQGFETSLDSAPPLEVLAAPAQKEDLYTQVDSNALNDVDDPDSQRAIAPTLDFGNTAAADDTEHGAEQTGR